MLPGCRTLPGAMFGDTSLRESMAHSTHSTPPACDLLIFTAVSSEEKALRRVAGEMQLEYAKARTDLLGEYIDLGTIGRNRVLAVQTHMGPFSSNGSAAKALQWLAVTKASAIIGVGMAFGTLPKLQKYGDVLVATSLLPYDYKIVRCDPSGNLLVDYTEVKPYPAHAGLLTLFERAAREPDWRGHVYLGPFLSGASRIHCAAHRDELCAAFPDRGIIVGGDMEGIGLLASSDEKEPRWIMVKGISDFADAARDSVIKGTRPTACYDAASFVLWALLNEETLRAPA